MQREDTHLYEELGIDPTKQNVLALSEKEIASAYRKAALRWHPDKNRDNPKASEKFSRVFLAYEILSSTTRRREYDDKIRVFRQRRQSFLQQDATRRKMRQQLEQREFKAAQTSPQPPTRSSATGFNDENAFARIQREVERLRRQAMQERENDQAKSKQGDDRASEHPETEPLNPPSSLKEKVSSKHSLHAGPWTDVPGFSAFRSKSIDIDFTDFERTILGGQSPFDQAVRDCSTTDTRGNSKNT